MADGNKQYFYQETENGAVKRTFRIQDEITLIAGDADGDGQTKWQDYERIRRYVERVTPWSDTRTKPADYDTNSMSRLLWDASVYNPDSPAYHCDLNSDGVISMADLNILTTYDNYNKTEDSYRWAGNVLPNGMKAPGYTGPAVLFALRELDGWEDAPVPYDPVGDAQVIPDELVEGEEEQPEQPELPETPAPDENEAETPECPEDTAVPADPELPLLPEERPEESPALPPELLYDPEEDEETPAGP